MSEMVEKEKQFDKIYAAVRKGIEAEAAAAAFDLMIYGRTVLCETPDGLKRVPPEEWAALTGGKGE